MASVFTMIIEGKLPGHFVWRDERCVAFLSIHPIQPGHTLVVPIEEVGHWIDLDAELLSHVTIVSQKIARAIQQVYSPVKVGSMYAGLEVEHVHQHLVPVTHIGDMSFANADTGAGQEALAAEAQKIRDALRAAGHQEVSGD